MKRTIFYPNKIYIPPIGTIARKQWDEQEARIAEDKREQAFQSLIANAIGKTGTRDGNGAYLLKE